MTGARCRAKGWAAVTLKDSWTVYYRGRKVDGASAMTIRESRRRVWKGCLEGILHGRGGEGRLGTNVRRTRGRIRERRMESLLPGERAAGGIAGSFEVPRDSW